ncbi:MAG: hypothetical protein WD738_20075 [Pirellulales bacterium]
MNLKRRWIAGGEIGLILVLTYGCGGPAYEYDSVVTGTVTIDGELAKSGTVTFHPVNQGKPAIGRIHPDGSYSLRTGQGDLKEPDGGTVVSGEYLVTVSVTAPPAKGATLGEGGPPIPGPSLIHSNYAQKSTTDLSFTVKPGKQVIVLNLEGPEPAPPAEESPESPPGETSEAAEAPVDSEPAPPTDSPPANGVEPEAAPPAPDNQADNLEQ